MRYSAPLQWGVLLRRWARFLAEVRLGDGREVVVHVPNSGAMRGCGEPGSPCLLSYAPGPRRRLDWTLEQVVSQGVPVAVNTTRANRVAEEALCGGIVRLDGVSRHFEVRREVPVAPGTRLDLCLLDGDRRVWVEVKSVTWVEGGVALFPDAVTRRGTKHLVELQRLAAAGTGAVVLFVVQRGDASALRAAGKVDPNYARALEVARAAGVEARAVQVAVSPAALVPWRELPVLPD